MGFKEFMEKRAEKKKEKQRKADEAEQKIVISIADQLTTKTEYRKVEREAEKLSEKIDDGKVNLEDLRAAKDHNKRIYAALRIARDRGYEWQCLPDFDYNTPLEVVESAYKRIKNKLEKNRLEELNPGCCYSLDIDDPSDDLEEKPEGFNQYKALIKKLASEVDLEKKATIIDQWKEKNSDLSESFGVYSGADFLESVLKKAGVPRPALMVRNGYNTPQKCFALSEQDFKALKGVGDKVVDLFAKFKENFKDS